MPKKSTKITLPSSSGASMVPSSAESVVSSSMGSVLPPLIIGSGSKSTAPKMIGESKRAHRNQIVETAGQYEEDHPDLAQLEQRLNDEVDDEFFADPRRFHTLHRVIDVLGMQLVDDLSTPKERQETLAQLERNPAYRALKDQQNVVEHAIEHLAMIHCADLNGSVVQVGRVARQFHDAVSQVRLLRRQVEEIQETLGASASSGIPSNPRRDSTMPNATTPGNGAASSVQSGATAAAASAMSLRELWLKKLECEAVMTLLEKLDRIRAAPMQFDWHLKNSRIGAAVVTLANALDTMFSDDVAQVQALHKIMEQLMLRKQMAEEVVWEVLMDVIFLRSGNGVLYLQVLQQQQQNMTTTTTTMSGSGPSNATVATGTTSVASDGKRVSVKPSSNAITRVLASTPAYYNPFVTTTMRYALDMDLDPTKSQQQSQKSSSPNDDSPNDPTVVTTTMPHSSTIGVADDWMEDDTDSVSLSSGVGGAQSTALVKKEGAAVSFWNVNPPTTSSAAITKSVMIPKQNIDAELDLVADEERGLDELTALGGMIPKTISSGKSSSTTKARPNYLDHILALRILVESLVQLKRLDDVERIVSEVLEVEVIRLRQREQARTFARLEQQPGGIVGGSGVRRWMMASTGTSANPSTNTTSATSNTAGGAGSNANASTKPHHPTALDLKEVLRHLKGLLSAYGTVRIRLAHLAQIVRHRLSSDKALSTSFSNPSSAMAGVLQSAKTIMEREIKEFLKACLREVDPSSLEENNNDNNKNNTRTTTSRWGRGFLSSGSNSNAASRATTSPHETGLFSLGIINKREQGDHKALAMASRSTIMELSSAKFVMDVLAAKTNISPQVRYALFFRKALAHWKTNHEALERELAAITGEDTSAPSYKARPSEPVLNYLDKTIQTELLPVLQEEAVNGTVQALERSDAFDPVLDRTVYTRAKSNEPQDVDMCKACNALYSSTGPLFLALHRLPVGGDMYLPLVAVLEHVILTFISRVKQQVGKLVNDKSGLELLLPGTSGSTTNTSTSASSSSGTTFNTVMEQRKSYAELLRAYSQGDMLDVTDEHNTGGGPGTSPLSPPPVDTPRTSNSNDGIGSPGAKVDDLDLAGGVDREESILAKELSHVKPFLEFGKESMTSRIAVCTDEQLMKAACLAHSLLKLASLLDARLRVRSHLGVSSKPLPSTRALREAIKTIKANGIKMAKFCRSDLLMQVVIRLSKVCTSSTLVARDAVRIPSSVNDLGEYLTAASDNLREAAGNAVTAYAFSSLEQYIPLCLIQTVRVVASGDGIIKRAPLTMNGIESLDRSGSVLYRDLKGATSFDNSFWDVELAAVSFERSASFMAMMELEMPELEAYYQANHDDFSDADFQLMFSMDGPRRKGDIGRYHMLNRRLKNSPSK